MSEPKANRNNNDNSDQESLDKLTVFHLSLPDIENINKLLSYGYKLVDESDKDIQQFIKNKRIQENKSKKKRIRYFHSKKLKECLVDRKKLSDNIRGLPEEQLKGILNLIDTKSEAIEKDGFYELDIDSLCEERLKQIEKYVRSCLKSSGYLIPTRYKDEFKKLKKENNEENDDTDKKKKNKKKNKKEVMNKDLTKDLNINGLNIDKINPV